MENITDYFDILLKKCIISAYPLTEPSISKYSISYGSKTDYQFNQINALAKTLNLDNNIISSTIHNKLFEHDIIESVKTIVINNQLILTINVESSYLEKMINKLYLEKTSVPKISGLTSTSVLIDFSSPNVAKEMHVGHLRSTIIGESLCRVFEYVGCDVKRVNHIGDWGTQFGMLIAYVKKNNVKVEENGLKELMSMYKESRKLFDADPEFKKLAHMETVRLQQGSQDNIDIWKNICQISMASFNKIYEQLGTHAEVLGESFYQDRMVQLVKDLKDKLVDSDGMVVLFPKGFKIPYILVKSDGGFTYDTSDLAAARYRLLEQKVDQVIYVIDSGQQQHMEMLFQVVNELGWSNDKLKYVGFGLVLGSDGKKLKTRCGETIRLQDLLDLANDHAKNVTTNLAKKNHPDWDGPMIEMISKKIAINCIKYADLCNPRLSNYKFDLKKMINHKGNTAVNLMYALARCKGIIRKIPNLDEVIKGDIIIDSVDSKNLVFKLLCFPDTINNAIKHLAPNHLCNYLYELVELLTKFYEKNRCIEFDDHQQIVHIYQHRIRLINLVIGIMSKLFYLIGLEHVEQI